jgi:hypothetical protein
VPVQIVFLEDNTTDADGLIEYIHGQGIKNVMVSGNYPQQSSNSANNVASVTAKKMTDTLVRIRVLNDNMDPIANKQVSVTLLIEPLT